MNEKLLGEKNFSLLEGNKRLLQKYLAQLPNKLTYSTRNLLKRVVEN